MFKLFSIVVLGIMLASAPCIAGGYSRVELNPNSNAFFFAGKDLSDHVKVDLWAINAGEIGLTIGPKIGRFNIGFGANVAKVDGKLEVSYINIDLGFGTDYRGAHWQSYYMYQYGLKGMDNFILSRTWISHTISPVGIVGHNTKAGDEDLEAFWGPYVELGKMGIFASNKIGVGINIRDIDSLWALWAIGF